MELRSNQDRPTRREHWFAAIEDEARLLRGVLDGARVLRAREARALERRDDDLDGEEAVGPHVARLAVRAAEPAAEQRALRVVEPVRDGRELDLVEAPLLDEVVL